MVFQYAIATGKTRHNIVADMRGAIRPKRPVHQASIIDTRKIGGLLLDLGEYEGQFQVRCALAPYPPVLCAGIGVTICGGSNLTLRTGFGAFPPTV
jgi:hypothetical protein